jgi:hypothetical protein
MSRSLIAISAIVTKRLDRGEKVPFAQTTNHLYIVLKTGGARGGAVVEALRYKPEGRGIDSRLCHWNFSLT